MFLADPCLYDHQVRRFNKKSVAAVGGNGVDSGLVKEAVLQTLDHFSPFPLLEGDHAPTGDPVRIRFPTRADDIVEEFRIRHILVCSCNGREMKTFCGISHGGCASPSISYLVPEGATIFGRPQGTHPP